MHITRSAGGSERGDLRPVLFTLGEDLCVKSKNVSKNHLNQTLKTMYKLSENCCSLCSDNPPPVGSIVAIVRKRNWRNQVSLRLHVVGTMKGLYKACETGGIDESGRLATLQTFYDNILAKKGLSPVVKMPIQKLERHGDGSIYLAKGLADFNNAGSIFEGCKGDMIRFKEDTAGLLTLSKDNITFEVDWVRKTALKLKDVERLAVVTGLVIHSGEMYVTDSNSGIKEVRLGFESAGSTSNLEEHLYEKNVFCSFVELSSLKVVCKRPREHSAEKAQKAPKTSRRNTSDGLQDEVAST